MAQPERLGVPRLQWLARNKGEERALQYIVSAGPLDWLVDMLMDAGGCKREATPNGERFAPLGWAEIAAWIAGSEQHHISPIWRREVMTLSAHYAAQLERSFELACPAPYEPE